MPDTSAAAPAPCAIHNSSGSISCPQGHTCLLWTYADDHHACDLSDDSAFAAACRGDFEVGDQGYRCYVCNYDLCVQCYSALTAAVPALTDAIGNHTIAAATPVASVVNFATEWLDELGRICPKAVDYASQCPKGHALGPLADGGGSASAQRLMCRICHDFTERQQALLWLVCSVAGCCGGYTVCDTCVSALQQAPAAVAAGEGFSSQVNCAA